MENKRAKLTIGIIIFIIGVIILSFCSCEKQNYLPTFVNPIEIDGTWVEKKFPQNKITITDSTITQVGFPLVAGDDIKHKNLKCNYRTVFSTQERDSFKLNILWLKGDTLNLEIDNYFGTRDKIFYRK